MTTAGRPEAAAAIWSWEERPGTPHGETAGSARRRGLLRAIVVLAMGGLLFAFWSRTLGTVVLVVGGVIGFSALISPTGLYAGVEGLFVALGRWTGRGLTWLLLVPLFYLFFLPFGLLLRRGRRDRLKRYLEQDAESYWEPHSGATAASSSRMRQY
jgi:hypothetical protein